MRPGTKLAVLLAACVLFWGGIALLFHFLDRPEKRAVQVARTALMASVDNPESVTVVAVSRPDSVFGREYVNDDEKMAVAVSMMKLNEKVMSQTDSLKDLDFSDSELSEIVARQMSAMSALRSMTGFSPPDAPRKPFSGWKVKIEYEAVSAGGHPYRSEYWFILDRDARCVVNSFEIPLV